MKWNIERLSLNDDYSFDEMAFVTYGIGIPEQKKKHPAFYHSSTRCLLLNCVADCTITN